MVSADGVAHSTQDNNSEEERGGIAFHCTANTRKGGPPQPVNLWAEDQGREVFGEKFSPRSFADEVEYLLGAPEEANTLSSSPHYEGIRY